MRFLKITIAICFIVVGANAYAAAPFGSLSTGQYACYLDQRGDMNFYRGYWYASIDNGQHYFFISNVDLDTGNQINFGVTFGLDEAGEPELLDIQGLGEDTPPEFTQCWADILNFVHFRMNNEEKITTDCYLEDPWDNYVQVYHYSSAAPFFGFLDIGLDGGKPVYKLDRAGAIHLDNIADFFALLPLDRSRTGEQAYEDILIEERPSEELPMGPRTIMLDDRWSPNDSLGFPGYWLSHEGFRDSQIMLESTPWSNYEGSEITSMERFAAIVIPYMGTLHYDTFTSYYMDDILFLESYLEDERGNRNYLRIYHWIENGIFYNLNFSSFASIYDANKPYYEKIIQSFLSAGKESSGSL